MDQYRRFVAGSQGWLAAAALAAAALAAAVKMCEIAVAMPAACWAETVKMAAFGAHLQSINT